MGKPGKKRRKIWPQCRPRSGTSYKVNHLARKRIHVRRREVLAIRPSQSSTSDQAEHVEPWPAWRQHVSFGISTWCALKMPPLLMKLACSFIWLEDGHVVDVRDGMDCKLGFLSSPGLLDQSTFGKGNVLFLSDSKLLHVGASIVPRGALDNAAERSKMRHGRSISQLAPQLFLYARREVQPTRNLWSGSSSSSWQQRSSDQMRERSDWQASADWNSSVQARERDSWQSPFKLQ